MTAGSAPFHLLISHLRFPSVVNETPKYLNSSPWGSNLFPSQRGLQIASDFTSHLTANHLGACWSSQPDKADRTTSCKLQRCDPETPSWALSTPWLCLKTLPIKIMNKIAAKGSCGRIPLSTSTHLTYYWHCASGSHFIYTGTKWHTSAGPYNPRATPICP